LLTVDQKGTLTFKKLKTINRKTTSFLGPAGILLSQKVAINN
jgi:hypothetical protein